MTIARCPSCRWIYDVGQSFTGRQYFLCKNQHCPDYGAQEWVPEPLHEEVTRDSLYVVVCLLLAVLLIFGYDHVAEQFRQKGGTHDARGNHRPAQAEAVPDR